MGQGRLEAAIRSLSSHSGTTSLKQQISLRKAKHRDLTGILRIERACFDRDAWPREYFRHYLERPEAIFLIAASSSRTLGYAVAAQRQAAWALDSLAVLPNARKRGIATRLLQRIIRILTRQKARALSLMVRRDNVIAIHVYRRFGFQPMRRINDYYEDGAAAWRMRLRLN